MEKKLETTIMGYIGIRVWAEVVAGVCTESTASAKHAEVVCSTAEGKG